MKALGLNGAWRVYWIAEQLICLKYVIEVNDSLMACYFESEGGSNSILHDVLLSTYAILRSIVLHLFALRNNSITDEIWYSDDGVVD